MSCFTELTYAIHADGELPPEQTRAVELHLTGCARCRALLEALRAENYLLVAALQQTEAEPLAAPARGRAIFWAALGLLGLAVGLDAVLSWLSETPPTGALAWLNPFSLAGRVSLFFNSLFYFFKGGATMLLSGLLAVSLFVFGPLVVVGGLHLVRRRPRTVSVLVSLALILLLAVPGMAAENRKGRTVTVGANETVDGTLIANGETVIIDGTVNGDLFAFGRRVDVRGTVKGSTFVWAQTLSVEGETQGNLFAFCQTMALRGAMGGNLYAFLQSLQLGSSGRVAGDVTVFGAEANLDGTIGRDASTYSSATEVRGTIGRNLTVHTDQLTVLGSATIGGNVTAHLRRQENAHIDPGATIAGKTETRLVQPRKTRYARPRFYLGEAVSLAAAFLTGLVLFWLSPTLLAGRMESAGAFLRTAALGFAVLVATPVAVLIVGITLIGLPVALLSLALWLAALYLAKIFVAGLLGQALLRPPTGQTASLSLALLVGLLVVFVGMNVPYVGGAMKFVVIVLGMGLAVLQVRQLARRPAASA